MAFSMTKADISRMAKRAEALQTRAKNALKKADHAVNTGIRTAEVGVSAFGFGVLQGRGGAEIFGVPADLAASLALHAAGFMGVGGVNSPHLHNFGDGALAAYASNMGRGVGSEWKRTGKLTAPGKDKVAGESLSDSEMAALARGA